MKNTVQIVTGLLEVKALGTPDALKARTPYWRVPWAGAVFTHNAARRGFGVSGDPWGLPSAVSKYTS